MACARGALLFRFQFGAIDETRTGFLSSWRRSWANETKPVAGFLPSWRGSWANETKPAAGLWRLRALAEKLIQKEPGKIKPIKNIQCGRCHGY